MSNYKILSSIKKNSVKTFIVIPVIASSLIFTSPVHAIDNTQGAPTTSITKSANPTTTNTASKLVTLKQKAEKEIDRRVTSMNDLITKINTTNKLSQAQKDSFDVTLQTNISNLTTLRAKIDADTNIDTLRVDVKAIIEQYRIFAILEPQIRLLKSSDIIDASIVKMNSIASKINIKILQLQSKGKNVTSLEMTYSDLLVKLADAKVQSDGVNNSVISLTPSSYPATNQFKQARSDLKQANLDLKGAREDIKSIMNAFKTITVSTTLNSTSSVSQTVTLGH